MSKLDVRIVKLEPMRMISLYGFGSSPEMQAWEKLIAWAKAKGLWEDGKPRRLFGFNNPDPSPSSPNYGYEVWMTVEASVWPDGEARLVEFPGGSYAVTRCDVKDPGLDILQTWKKLVAWMENSQYRHAHHQCLEEHLGLVEGGSSEFVLDLYLPIAE